MSRSNQLPNLDKLFRDDDEQDFMPLGGSNLAAIFGAPQKSESASSLRSVPQKKPASGRNTPKSPTPSSKTEVIIAKVVHAYKLQNGQYSLIGKVGIALTGNANTRTYILILYKTKQEHLSVITLTQDFSYSVRENNYGTYYDSNNENWSILFENSEAAIAFAREVALSKYFLRQGKSEDNVFCQDLTTGQKGEGDEVEVAKENDEISIKYLIIANISQPLKFNNIPVQTMKVQISSDENWEKSLLGVKSGLKRILILPPSKQISLGPGYPREKDIAMEIEIIEIINREPRKQLSPKLPMSSGKASLISRMAKMGQSMLPKPPMPTTDSEDTEDEVHIKSPRRLRASHDHVQPKNGTSASEASTTSSGGGTTPVQTAAVLGQRSLVASAITSPHGTIVPATAFAHSWTPPIQSFVSNVDGQFYPFQPAISPQLPIDPNMNVFLSESRTHNAEIRMGMSKIADNVQKLLDKFHVLEVQSAASPTNERALEASLKMLLSLNLGKNDIKPAETSEITKNLLEATEAKDRVRLLEDEFKSTRTSLSRCSSELEKVESEKKKIKEETSELRERIQKLETSLSESQIALQKALNELKDSNQIEIKHQKENATLEAKLITVEAEKKALEKKMSISRHEKALEIKQIMNKTYQTLVGKFTEDSYTTEFIKRTVAGTIKAITLQILKEGKEDTDIEMKDAKSLSDSTGIGGDDEEMLTLPDVEGISDHGMDIASGAHDEPPPIPPMDLDVENDWLP